MSLRSFAFAFLCFVALPLWAAEPLSKSYALDFFRDVPSRNLRGLATRSDGRIVLGPTLTDLDGPALPALLWCLEPSGPNRWLIGTGPAGKVVEVSLDPSTLTYSSQERIALPEQQVLAVKPLPDGSFLAGTSPDAGVFLIHEHAIVAQILLPADSVFDIALHNDTGYIATGNPARIYAIDLAKFAADGVTKERLRDPAVLAAKGITKLGDVRDRNIRRLAWVGDRLIAGTAPKGNIYAFSLSGGAPELLQENRDAEVSAFLPQHDGSFYAAIIFSNSQGESRINRAKSGKPANESAGNEAAAITPIERFTGRSSIVYFPKNGFPETTVSRAGVAFYALGLREQTLLISGGEQGDVLGYDLVARESLSYSGSNSAQLNALAALSSPEQPGRSAPVRFLALRNNEPGLSMIDFDVSSTRSAETQKIDLGVPARLGALRIERLREISPQQIKVEVRTSLGTDDIEGWNGWTAATPTSDGWLASSVRAREIKLRIQLSPTPGSAPELDNASLFYLPQNRRPQLAEFRFAPPDFALLPASQSNNATITLGQLLASENDQKRRSSLTNNTVVPSPGNQLVFWTVTDPDNDAIAYTFSISRDGSDHWQDLAVDTPESYLQFNTTHLEDGVYLTRLTAREQAPRAPNERLSSTFMTADLVIDHTPPTIAEVTATRSGSNLTIRVSGHDALSLLDSAEFVFNNGDHEVVAQPADGILDSQTETFVLEITNAKTAGATTVQVLLNDAANNTSSKVIDLPQ